MGGNIGLQHLLSTTSLNKSSINDTLKVSQKPMSKLKLLFSKNSLFILATNVVHRLKFLAAIWFSIVESSTTLYSTPLINCLSPNPIPLVHLQVPFSK